MDIIMYGGNQFWNWLLSGTEHLRFLLLLFMMESVTLDNAVSI